jgi:uncharacterized NAD(P)/FAD-binding protein YdhS
MKVAIIGFGATGVSAFVQLTAYLSSANHSFDEIAVISRENEFIGGRAFVTPDPEHLLNTPARLMSCYPEQPLHFAEWLQTEGINTPFPPRNVFARYLAEQYGAAKKRAVALGIRVVELLQEATRIKVSSEGRYLVRLADEREIAVERVIYTPGQPMTPLAADITKSKAYRHFDSHAGLLPDIPTTADGSVSILGSGLTAIDAVLSASKRRGIKHIHLFSRTGLLPSINRRDPNDNQWILEPRYLTQDNLQELMSQNNFNFHRVLRLLSKDLDRYPTHEIRVGLESLRQRDFVRYYHNVLPLARRNFLPLQSLLASTRDYFSDLWSSATEHQKAHFEAFARHWTIFRHPIPYENGLKILSLLEAGRLSVHAATAVEQTPEGVAISTRHGVRKFPAVIGAMGYGFALEHSESRFDKSLIANNIVTPHEFGGISVCRIRFRPAPVFSPPARSCEECSIRRMPCGSTCSSRKESPVIS